MYTYNTVGEISTVVFTNALGQTTRAEYIRTNGWNCGYVLTLANGSAIIRTLERDWERPQLVTRVLTTFNGNTIRDYQYAYDILGRITNRIDSGVQMNNFAYNPRSEVLYALFGTNETDYAYDDIGNHDLYPANSLNQYADNSIAYDADGNMTQKGGWTFGWDAENRLVSANDGTTSITNAYDYKHRRVWKTINGESHTFVYDGWNLLGETVNDTELTHYFWGLDLSDSLQGAGGVGGICTCGVSSRVICAAPRGFLKRILNEEGQENFVLRPLCVCGAFQNSPFVLNQTEKGNADFIQIFADIIQDKTPVFMV